MYYLIVDFVDLGLGLCVGVWLDYVNREVCRWCTRGLVSSFVTKIARVGGWVGKEWEMIGPRDWQVAQICIFETFNLPLGRRFSRDRWGYLFYYIVYIGVFDIWNHVLNLEGIIVTLHVMTDAAHCVVNTYASPQKRQRDMSKVPILQIVGNCNQGFVVLQCIVEKEQSLPQGLFWNYHCLHVYNVCLVDFINPHSSTFTNIASNTQYSFIESSSPW